MNIIMSSNTALNRKINQIKNTAHPLVKDLSVSIVKLDNKVSNNTIISSNLSASVDELDNKVQELDNKVQELENKIEDPDNKISNDFSLSEIETGTTSLVFTGGSISIASSECDYIKIGTLMNLTIKGTTISFANDSTAIIEATLEEKFIPKSDFISTYIYFRESSDDGRYLTLTISADTGIIVFYEGLSITTGFNSGTTIIDDGGGIIIGDGPSGNLILKPMRLTYIVN